MSGRLLSSKQISYLSQNSRAVVDRTEYLHRKKRLWNLRGTHRVRNSGTWRFCKASMTWPLLLITFPVPPTPQPPLTSFNPLDSAMASNSSSLAWLCLHRWPKNEGGGCPTCSKPGSTNIQFFSSSWCGHRVRHLVSVTKENEATSQCVHLYVGNV